MREDHWIRVRPYIKSHNDLETIINYYELKPYQYLRRDLDQGKSYSLHLGEMRKERVVKVIEYAGKRGWL